MGPNCSGMAAHTARVSRRKFLLSAGGTVGAGAVVSRAGAQEGESHQIEMTDDLVFEPDAITIAPGDTITWETVGSVGHSVTAYEEQIPADAEYFASGGFDSESAARSGYAAGDPDSGDVPEGETYEHTFEVEGEYEYFCIPHEGTGMVGSVTVQPGGAQEEPAEAVEGPAIPDVATDIAVGAAAVLLGMLSLVYLFIKFGGDYGVDEE